MPVIRAPASRGTLYVVATPIGHLDDLSQRALETLRNVSLIACEDTRKTGGLLARHQLRARLVSHHRFNEARSASGLLETLRRGESVALVTDGGTPGISDPGALLVRLARAEGHAIVPVPGPSALTALLSVSGFPAGPFTFIGFLPHRKGERRRTLQSLRGEPRPLLFFEAPHRIHACLLDAQEILGDREAFLGREMTKRHEELLSGPLSSLRAALADRDARGEFALLISGAAAADAAAPPGDEASSHGEPPSESIASAMRRLVDEGLDRKEAMRRVARARGVSRREVYRALLKIREEK
jgi:16S rRNA (cytidine1402-2'-O)-methyltransferase